MRGRKPTPTALKLLRGQTARNSALEPKPPAGVPECPPDLDDIAKRQWNSLAAVLSPMGCLTTADATSLKILCAALSRYDRATKAMASEGEVVEHDKQGRIRNPWLQVLREAEATIDKISTKFGMTPMDRTRIKVGGDGKRKDELQDFLSGTG